MGTVPGFTFVKSGQSPILSGQVAREISILQLNPSRDLHLEPINLVVFKVSLSWLPRRDIRS